MDDQIRILCVDDEASILNALVRIFMDSPYEILTADSGEKGLIVLEQTPQIQVVMSDYRMSGMNGVDFLREVCKKWPDTVRIVLSGYADTASVVAAINEGEIYKFISKPWSQTELKDAVREALARYRTLEQTRTLAEEALAASTKMFDEHFGQFDGVQQRILELESALDEVKYYQWAYESSAVPLLIIPRSGRPVLANQAARTLWPKSAGATSPLEELVARVTEFIEDTSAPTRQDWILPLNGSRWRVLVDPLGGDCAEMRVVVAVIPQP